MNYIRQFTGGYILNERKVRELIATDQEWKQFVPKSVYYYLTENELDKRVKRLELMRIEEKKAIEQMNIAEAVERLEMMESQDMD